MDQCVNATNDFFDVCICMSTRQAWTQTVDKFLVVVAYDSTRSMYTTTRLEEEWNR
jgi:hypothetical protein